MNFGSKVRLVLEWYIRVELKLNRNDMLIPLVLVSMITDFSQIVFSLCKWSSVHKSPSIALTKDHFKATTTEDGWQFIISDTIMNGTDVNCFRFKAHDTDTYGPFMGFGMTCYDSSGEYSDRQYFKRNYIWGVHTIGPVFSDGILIDKLSFEMNGSDMIIDMRYDKKAKSLRIICHDLLGFDYTLTAIPVERGPFVPYVNMRNEDSSVQIARIGEQEFGLKIKIEDIETFKYKYFTFKLQKTSILYN